MSKLWLNTWGEKLRAIFYHAFKILVLVFVLEFIYMRKKSPLICHPAVVFYQFSDICEMGILSMLSEMHDLIPVA